MLLIALGLVVTAMRQLQQPRTAQRIGQLFARPGQEATPPSLGYLQGSSETTAEPATAEPPAAAPPFAAGQAAVLVPAEPAVKNAPSGEGPGDRFTQVQDNTYFRPAEQQAWFELFAQLQKLDPQQLQERTVGELTYAQLLKQPEVYRGQVVTIRGTLRREEVQTPAENSIGLEAYHRLIIQPRGGSVWPWVVYCLELPEGLPRGEGLQTPITVTGFFFKNWSYAWQDGLGIAPVVLARDVQWEPSSVAPSPRPTTRRAWGWALLGASVWAAVVVWWALRSSRRLRSASPQAPTLPDPRTDFETIDQQLERLSETEPHP
jgi:hypothetical protein